MSEPIGIIAPIIHLNGTSAFRLKEALEHVYTGLCNVREDLRECAPNGRDYYLKPGKLDLAIEQHRRRDDVLGKLMAEIELEMEAIDKQSN